MHQLWPSQNPVPPRPRNARFGRRYYPRTPFFSNRDFGNITNDSFFSNINNNSNYLDPSYSYSNTKSNNSKRKSNNNTTNTKDAIIDLENSGTTSLSNNNSNSNNINNNNINNNNYISHSNSNTILNEVTPPMLAEIKQNFWNHMSAHSSYNGGSILIMN